MRVCDICGRALDSSISTAFNSVVVKIICNDTDVSYDLCPGCKKRMEKYPKMEAKRGVDDADCC